MIHNGNWTKKSLISRLDQARMNHWNAWKSMKKTIWKLLISWVNYSCEVLFWGQSSRIPFKGLWRHQSVESRNMVRRTDRARDPKNKTRTIYPLVGHSCSVEILDFEAYQVWSPTLGSLDITQVIEGKSYRAFEELMSPFEGHQGIDLQIYAVLLAVRFIPFVLALFVVFDPNSEHDNNMERPFLPSILYNN